MLTPSSAQRRDGSLLSSSYQPRPLDPASGGVTLFRSPAFSPAKRQRASYRASEQPQHQQPAEAPRTGSHLCTLPPREVRLDGRALGALDQYGWAIVANTEGHVWAWELTVSLKGTEQAKVPRRVYEFDGSHVHGGDPPLVTLLAPTNSADGASSGRGLAICSASGNLTFYVDARTRVGEPAHPIEHTIGEVAESRDPLVQVLALSSTDVVCATKKGVYYRVICNTRLREVRHQQVLKPGGFMRGLNQVIFGGMPEDLTTMRRVPGRANSFVALTTTTLQCWEVDREVRYKEVSLMSRIRNNLQSSDLPSNEVELVDAVPVTKTTLWVLSLAQSWSGHSSGISLSLHEVTLSSAGEFEVGSHVRELRFGREVQPPADGNWQMMSVEGDISTIYLTNTNSRHRLRRFYYLSVDGLTDFVHCHEMPLPGDACLSAGVMAGQKSPFLMGADAQIFVMDPPLTPDARPYVPPTEDTDPPPSDEMVEQWEEALTNAFNHRDGELQQISSYLRPLHAFLHQPHTRYASTMVENLVHLSARIIGHEMNGSALVHHVLEAKRREHTDLGDFLDLYIWKNCHANWREALTDARSMFSQHRQQLEAAIALEQLCRKLDAESVLRLGLDRATEARYQTVLKLRTKTTGLRPVDLFFEQPSQVMSGLLASTKLAEQSPEGIRAVGEVLHATILALTGARRHYRGDGPCWTSSHEVRQVLQEQFALLEKFLEHRQNELQDGSDILYSLQDLILNAAHLWLLSFTDPVRHSAGTQAEREEYAASKEAVLKPLIAVAVKLPSTFEQWVAVRQPVLGLCEQHLIFDGLVTLCVLTRDNWRDGGEGLSKLQEYMQQFQSDIGTELHQFPRFVLEWLHARKLYADALALGQAHQEVLTAHLNDKQFRWIDELRVGQSGSDAIRCKQFDKSADSLLDCSKLEPQWASRKTLLSLAKLSALASESTVSLSGQPVYPSKSSAHLAPTSKRRIVERDLALMQVQENLNRLANGEDCDLPGVVMKEDDMLQAALTGLERSRDDRERALAFAMTALVITDIVYGTRPEVARRAAIKTWRAIIHREEWRDIAHESDNGRAEELMQQSLVWDVIREQVEQLENDEFTYAELQFGKGIMPMEVDDDQGIAGRLSQCVTAVDQAIHPGRTAQFQAPTAPPMMPYKFAGATTPFKFN